MTKYQFFTKLPPNLFTHLQNCSYVNNIGNNRPTASTFFMAGTCKESTFAFLAVVSPLTAKLWDLRESLCQVP